MNEIDIAFKLHEGINFYWHFYVPSCVAILGWVFSRKEPWPVAKRMMVSALFIGFTIFNLIGLLKTYIALDAVVAVLALPSDTAELHPSVLEAITRRLDMGPWRLGIAFHLLVDGVILYFILRLSGKEIPAQ